MSLKNKTEEDWFASACGALATIEEEDNAEAEEEYAKAYSRLAKRLTAAEGQDSDGRLKAQMESAASLAGEGKFIEAMEALDAAGEIATELISKAPKKGAVTDLKSGDVKPLKGKEKGAKYIDEQYQEDEKGDVKHGGAFRGTGTSRTHYATDEEKDDSAMRVSDEGKLVDAKGNPIQGEMGYAVDAEQGTAHTFDPKNTSRPDKKGHKLYDHHTTPLQGKKAGAAGIQEVKDGVVRKINTESGHYRPEPEMTHQYVEGLKEQGVQMRDKKLMMFNDKGEAVDLDNTTQNEVDMVSYYEQTRVDRGDTGPYDPRYQEMKDNLKKKGVAPSERDATVEVFDKRSIINEKDWEAIKGDASKVEKFIEAKIGKPISDMVVQFAIKDPNDLVECNDVLGRYLRLGAGNENAGRVSMKAEQFAQTGGNMDAVEAKKLANTKIQQQHIDKLGGAAKLKAMGVEDPSKLPLAKQIAILEGTEPVPKAEEAKPVKKRRGFLGDESSGSGVRDEQPPVPKPIPEKPELKAKPLTTGDKAKGYVEGSETEDEDEEKSPQKPEFKAKPLTTEDKAKGYVEGSEAENEDEEKSPQKPELKAKPLTTEDKAKGYVEGSEAEDEDEEKSPKKPELKAKPLTTEDKAKGYVEGSEAEDEDKEEPPKKPELKAKPLTPEDKAKGYVEGSETEDEDEEKSPKQPELKVEPQASGGAQQQPKAGPPKAKAMNIGEIKKPTTAPTGPQQGAYDEKGGDEALLAKEADAWKKRNAKIMGTFRELEKRRKEAMAAFEASKSEDDKAKLDDIAKELAGFKKDLDAKDPLPTRVRLSKLPVAERLKRLG